MEALMGLEWLDKHATARLPRDNERLMFRLLDLKRALEKIAEVAREREEIIVQSDPQ